MKFLLHELADVVHGKVYELGDNGLRIDPLVTEEKDFSFSIDSRTIQPGQWFIALQGERGDGHDYLEQALQHGAGGCIISQMEPASQLGQKMANTAKLPRDSGGLPVVIRVDDTLVALQAIARACRQKHGIPVIGVTGSNGKTTVKDMTSAILEVRYGKHVLKSAKSFNNHIGLPLTLANMAEHHEIAIVEMGMNAPGEIRFLADIARPDIGAVINIAQAHVGFFDSIESIMRAKMELIESLPEDGIAVLNQDDNLYHDMRSFLQRGVRCVTFGIQHTPADADDPAGGAENPSVTVEHIAVSHDGTYAFTISTAVGTIPVSLNIPGYHNISNALAATAIATAVYDLGRKLPLQEVKEGLEQFQPSPMRMQVIEHRDMIIINDAYNANPTSMESALHTLKTLSCRGKKIALLGDMFELGTLSQAAHYHVGELAALVPVDRIFLLGKYAEDVLQGACKAGMKSGQIVIGESHEHLAAELASQIKAGDIVLCKASRGMTMEKVIEHLLKLVS